MDKDSQHYRPTANVESYYFNSQRIGNLENQLITPQPKRACCEIHGYIFARIRREVGETITLIFRHSEGRTGLDPWVREGVKPVFFSCQPQPVHIFGI